jgi:hypothetical protein
MTDMQIGKVMTHRGHQENGGKGTEEKVEKGRGKIEGGKWNGLHLIFRLQEICFDIFSFQNDLRNRTEAIFTSALELLSFGHRWVTSFYYAKQNDNLFSIILFLFYSIFY